MKYPLYVISKGRFENCFTAKFLVRNKTNFHLVVEPQEVEQYAARFGAERILRLPFSNMGLGSIPARNWVWEHAKGAGHERHWILDDNIHRIRRTAGGTRIPCNANAALSVVETFVDRYENVAIAGLNYTFFVIPSARSHRIPPFYLNNHVYSCLLIRNDLSIRWRGRYNEDTDLCLQVLADGWCTVLMNAFTIDKAMTMTMKGGNTDILYKGDGRLRMSRSLERMWPGVVTTGRRFGRPQHRIAKEWGRFDTPLKLKPGLTREHLESQAVTMKLVQKRAVVKSPRLQALLQADLSKLSAADDRQTEVTQG